MSTYLMWKVWDDLTIESRGELLVLLALVRTDRVERIPGSHPIVRLKTRFQHRIAPYRREAINGSE